MRSLSIDDYRHDADFCFEVDGMLVSVISEVDRFPTCSYGGSTTYVAEQLCPGILEDEPGNDDKLAYGLAPVPALGAVPKPNIRFMKLQRSIRLKEDSHLPPAVKARLLSDWGWLIDRVGQHVDFCQNAFENITIEVKSGKYALVRRSLLGVPHESAAELVADAILEAIDDAISLRGTK